MHQTIGSLYETSNGQPIAFRLTPVQGDETNDTLGSFSKRSSPRTKRDSYTSFPLEELKDLGKLFKKYFGYDYPEAVYTSLPNPFAWANSTQETVGRPTNLSMYFHTSLESQN